MRNESQQRPPSVQMSLCVLFVVIAVASVFLTIFVQNLGVAGTSYAAAFVAIAAVAIYGTIKADSLSLAMWSVVAFSILGMIRFWIQWLFVADIRSAIAVNAFICLLVASVLVVYWPHPIVLACQLACSLVATLVAVEGSRLRLYVDGSKFDYEGAPTIEWMGFVVFAGITWRTAYWLHRSRCSGALVS